MAKSPKRNTKVSSTSSNADTNNKPAKITVRKKKMWYYETIKNMVHIPLMINDIKELKEKAYYRPTMMGADLIWGDARFVATNKEGVKNRPYLVIFSMVARNAKEYIRDHYIKPSKWLPSNYWSKNDHTGYKIVGTDINSAYWEIAYKLGIIRQTTYAKGETDIKNKAILLASLSSLGSDKTYQVIKNGQFTNEYVVLKGNDQLKEIYKKIRYACYKHMKKMAEMLGEDFIGYKTDCIYYRNTAANVKKIRKYLDDNKLTFKMLKQVNKSDLKDD